ncbi:MAG TPA: HAD family phosphatase [Flavobacteriaceae bacterium]|nr:HAD family phosphatase [Flavobacteriaceae bacterium]
MIKTLLFDFGDIFINLDKAATEKELKILGLDNFSSEMLLWNQQYEKGEISTEDFIDTYKKVFRNTSREQLINAWNAILLDFPKKRLEFLKHLQQEKKYNLLLLSNTNELHIKWIEENVAHYSEFKNCFDGFYLSHEIGMRKPDNGVYEFILQKHRLQPEEVLFIDDTKENNDAAKQLGIKTWHLIPGKEDITTLLKTQKHLL